MLENESKAQLCCLILISCKAILGNHIGLTGDFDILLIAFLTASVYYFLLYFEKQNKYAIYTAALFTGLAFYTKGSASLVFVPGLIAYLFIRKKCFEIMKDKNVWLSIFIFVLIAGSWISLVYSFGKSTMHSFYNDKNSIETMFIHDTFKRFASTEFSPDNTHDSFFFFKAIDSRLNIWNYFFYASIIFGLYRLYINRKHFKQYLNYDSNRLTILSVCLILPLAIILTFSINQNNWYLAPIFMFIAFLTVQFLFYLINKFKFSNFIVLVLFCFALIRHLEYIYSLPQQTHIDLKANADLQGNKIIVVSDLKQNINLYLKWLNTDIIRLDSTETIEDHIGQMLLFNKNKIKNSFREKVVPLDYFDDYCLAKIKE